MTCQDGGGRGEVRKKKCALTKVEGWEGGVGEDLPDMENKKMQY